MLNIYKLLKRCEKSSANKTFTFVNQISQFIKQMKKRCKAELTKSSPSSKIYVKMDKNKINNVEKDDKD